MVLYSNKVVTAHGGNLLVESTFITNTFQKLYIFKTTGKLSAVEFIYDLCL